MLKAYNEFILKKQISIWVFWGVLTVQLNRINICANCVLILNSGDTSSGWHFLFPDLSPPEAPVCWGAPAGPVSKPAPYVCVPALPATHSESGGADPALWRNSLQNCAAGGYLHREVQRQETRGKQDPV